MDNRRPAGGHKTSKTGYCVLMGEWTTGAKGLGADGVL